MTRSRERPASYFPSIEKTYGQPISYWFDQIEGRCLTSRTCRSSRS